jgi:hypothetical protein
MSSPVDAIDIRALDQSAQRRIALLHSHAWGAKPVKSDCLLENRIQVLDRRPGCKRAQGDGHHGPLHIRDEVNEQSRCYYNLSSLAANTLMVVFHNVH